VMLILSFGKIIQPGCA